MCAIEAGKRGRARRGARTRRSNRQENSDLRRRPLQFHQPAHQPGEFSFRQSALRQIGARPLHSGRLHSDSSKNIASPTTRKNSASYSAIERRAISPDARTGMPRRRSRNPVQHESNEVSKASAQERGAQRPVYDEFTVQAEDANFAAPRLVVATGGLSIAKIGATSFGYDLARQFGLKIVSPTRPPWSLSSFSERTASAGAIWRESPPKWLLPLAAETNSDRRSAKTCFSLTTASVGPRFSRSLLTGTAGNPIHLDLAPGRNLIAELRTRGRRDLSSWKSLLREILPRRFADRWLETYPLAGNSDRALADAEQQLHAWEVKPTGTEGWKGGSHRGRRRYRANFPPRPWNVRKVPGLFFIGEVVDVTGQLGGFNFQWAWASGFCAGQAV
jgi:predicted flavoprotein YhiN